MIAKFAKKINEILIQKGIVQKEDAELYQYGIENGIVVAGNLLASGIFGIVTGRPGLVLVFLLFYKRQKCLVPSDRIELTRHMKEAI